MKRTILRSLLITGTSLLFSTLAMAQFGGTGTTTLGVTVGAEAAISVTTAATTLATTGTIFNPFTGTTNFTVKMRSTEATGTGSVTLKVTADFAGTGGPSVGTPPTAGDVLAYTCATIASGTGCTGTQTASTGSSTPVATFGPGAHSTTTGSTSSVSWSLTNDPTYKTGIYSATVTFTVSQT